MVEMLLPWDKKAKELIVSQNRDYLQKETCTI
jgi:hypothetical protein